MATRIGERDDRRRTTNRGQSGCGGVGRRRLLGLAGATGLSAVAGCLGSDDDGDGADGDDAGGESDSGDDESDSGDGEGGLVITEHDFTDDYHDVVGTVENTGDEDREEVQVCVRGYREDGSQEDHDICTPGEELVRAGDSWDFTVVLGRDPDGDDIVEYDIGIRHEENPDPFE